MPTPQSLFPSARPLGGVPPTRPAQPAGHDKPRPAAQRPMPAPGYADTLTLTGPLTNDRFAGSEALARVARGGALTPADRDAVTRVQQALLAMAFFIPGGADGAYGPGATQAMKNFQAAAGLPRTGKLDAATLRQLDRLAPPAGKTAWDPGVDRSLVPDPVVRDAQGRPYKTKDGQPMVARVVVAIGQHRVFHFDRNGELVKIYACRTGTAKHADGRGAATQPAVKRIDAKMSGAALRELGASKWDAPGAFGEALLALSKIDPATGKPVPFGYNGQELHGVPNNGRGEPTGVGQDFSHGCVGVANADIKAISADVRANDIVNFIP